MIRLQLGKEPRRVDLGHGVAIWHLPVSGLVLRRARAAGDAVTGENAEAVATRSDTITKSIARQTVVRWEGVGDDSGQAVEPSPEGIDALLDIEPLQRRFQVDVIGPALLVLDEKNGSPPSRNGTSSPGAEKNTAEIAPGAAPSARTH